MHNHVSHSARRSRALTALIWLLCGLALMLTPLAWPNRAMGFTALFWLIGAPASLLLALQPRLALGLFPARRNTRHARH